MTGEFSAVAVQELVAAACRQERHLAAEALRDLEQRMSADGVEVITWEQLLELADSIERGDRGV